MPATHDMKSLEDRELSRQGRHAVAPSVTEYVALSQTVQAVAADALEYVPPAQATHTDPYVEYLPAGQRSHTASDVTTP